jgi:hypothetical protein
LISSITTRSDVDARFLLAVIFFSWRGELFVLDELNLRDENTGVWNVTRVRVVSGRTFTDCYSREAAAGRGLASRQPDLDLAVKQEGIRSAHKQ